MCLVSMFRQDPEAFLRELAAPLSEARRGEPLPGIPFSREAVANAFVMLGPLREQHAEETWPSIARRWRLRASGSGC